MWSEVRTAIRQAALLLTGLRLQARSIARAQNRVRKVERPPYEQLLAELAAASYVGVGRRYGVSDNAVRKWVRAYERELARAADPPAGDASGETA